MERGRMEVESKLKVLSAETAEKEARANGTERELKIEREWRTSLQGSSESNVEKISQLRQEIAQLKKEFEVGNYIYKIYE